MNLARYIRTTATLVVLALIMAGCVQLAPKYDAKLYSDLTNVNAELLGFFSSVSMGTDKNSFSDRAGNYHSLIGKIDALAMQSGTRPMPDSKAIKKINEYLSSQDKTVLFDSKPPSVYSLQEISDNLNRMKKQDEDSGLKPGAVALFKNAVVISMDQALTYESFLNR